eukprot:3487377-Amphidinium_carterae.3
MLGTHEGAIATFLLLEDDDQIYGDMRLALDEWRNVFDMTDEEYEAYLAANSTAFPSAVELGEVRSKEEVLNAAKPKSVVRNMAVKTKPGEDEGDDKSHKGDPPPDGWAGYRKRHGMNCEPPRKNGGQDARGSRDGPSHPGEPDQPDTPRRSDRGNRKRKEKKGKKKKRSPTPSCSDSDDSSSSSSDDDSSSSSRKKKKGEGEEDGEDEGM